MKRNVPEIVKTDFDKRAKIIIKESSYVQEGAERTTFIKIDETTECSYTILYDKGYRKLAELTGTAIKVLTEVIFPRLRMNSNFITVTQVEAASIIGKDKFITNRAFKELIEKEFIAQSGAYSYGYVINHNYFFRGNIATFIKRYIEETKDTFDVEYIRSEDYKGRFNFNIKRKNGK